jgi:hypothetical protein
MGGVVKVGYFVAFVAFVDWALVIVSRKRVLAQPLFL